MYKETANKKNDEGEVEIMPRNIQTCGNGPKTGKNDDALFSVYPRAGINGEPFSNVNTNMMRNGKTLMMPAEHDRQFRPAKVVRLSHNAAFDHLSDYKHIKKNYRNEDGEVITLPRNVVTSNPKRGNCT